MAKKTSTRLVLVAVLGAIVLSGCGNSPPVESGSSQNSAPQMEHPTEAPQVEHPVDLSEYLGDKKCSLLSKGALSKVGFTGPATVNDFGICMWDGGSVSLSLTPDKSLSFVYDLRAKGKYGEFEPGSVKDYPIVATSGSASKQTFCAVHVGVSDTASFVVVVGDVGSFQDACNEGKDLAASAIDKLKAS